MPIKDGQGHLRNGTTITLVNPDKSNEPTNNTGNNTNEETNNLTTQIQKQMQILQQVIDGQKEAKESREKMQQDIRNIKYTNNEIRENVNLAIEKPMKP